MLNLNAITIADRLSSFFGDLLAHRIGSQAIVDRANRNRQ